MKIKVVFLEKDQRYLEQISGFFNAAYADTLEVYSFTDPDAAIPVASSVNANVFVASSAFSIQRAALPTDCAFAYFVDMTGITEHDGEPAICKYQKADVIYRKLLELYVETSKDKLGEQKNGSTNFAAFTSPAGGVGTSTLAAAYAMKAAQKGRVLFLSCEPFGEADAFFSGEGTADFGKVLFAIKGNKPNLSLLLDSYVRKDACGVCFFSCTKQPKEMLEFTQEDLRTLLAELNGKYETVVIDYPFSLSEVSRKTMQSFDEINMVSDGTEIANRKTERAIAALAFMEQNSEAPLLPRIRLLYNRFTMGSSKYIGNGAVTSKGLFRPYSGSPRTIAEKIVSNMTE